MKDKNTPLKLVRMWPKIIPSIYEQLDYLKGAKPDGEVWWPDYCLLPISAAFTYLSNYISKEEAAAVAAEVTACWTWRQNKVIYKFDDELARTLMEQTEGMEDTEELPVELLTHLPYPCVYIKCATIAEHVDGFFSWIEWDVNRKSAELRIQLVIDNFEHSIPMVIHLIPSATIKECIDDTLATTKELSGHDIDRGDAGFKTVLSAMQMLLYLTAENADVIDVLPPPKTTVRRDTGSNVIHLIRDKASEIEEKDVGIRIGATLRKSRKAYDNGKVSSGMGITKRPHARRGHWHHYWAGPKGGERRLILKWTAPTFIHPDESNGDNVVVFPVK